MKKPFWQLLALTALNSANLIQRIKHKVRTASAEEGVRRFYVRMKFVIDIYRDGVRRRVPPPCPFLIEQFFVSSAVGAAGWSLLLLKTKGNPSSMPSFVRA
jgi:hypothetical protein